MRKQDLILLTVIVIVVVATLWGLKIWNKMFSKVKDKTANVVFDDGIKIRELPQPHIESEPADSVPESEFRAFNPSVTAVEDSLIFSYRVSNYVACPAGSGKARRMIFGPTDDRVKSFTMLSNEKDEVLYLDMPDFAYKGCVSGFEDPRIITSPDNRTLYIVCNSHSNSNCYTEMHLIKIPVSEMKTAFATKMKPKMLVVKPNQIVRLREKSQEVPTRDQKNWMPFFDGEDLMFVYSVNPHVVLKCDLSSGLCKKIAETENPNVNPKLRGSSQARLYNGKYIAVAHWRTSSHSYLTQAYTFQAKFPYKVESISPTFVIKDEGTKALSMIQFVSGFEIKDETALIAYGERDCDSKLFTVSMESLLNSMEPV